MNASSLIIFVATAIFCCSAAEENPCGINEAKYPCGRRCEETCNTGVPSFCRGMQCLGFACRCKNGYARDPVTDLCVKTENCPRTECEPGEILAPCGRTCEGTCKNPSEPKICQAMFCIGASCRCDLGSGYVRDKVSGKCVLKENCPKC